MVDDANAIGTTYLRAQTLAEAVLARRSICCVAHGHEHPLSHASPFSDEALRAEPTAGIQRELWRLAGMALDGAPSERADLVETLNRMLDRRLFRVAALHNRVRRGSRSW